VEARFGWSEAANRFEQAYARALALHSRHS
jgi:hypothetical protein